jgi:hypothetical protein
MNFRFRILIINFIKILIFFLEKILAKIHDHSKNINYDIFGQEKWNFY